MRPILSAVALAVVLMPAAFAEDAPKTWTLEDGAIYPTARGLARAEDGLALSDGRLIVVDQMHGLRLIMPDQTSRPFGRFAETGFVHALPAQPAGPNGISLEPDGVHALVADVYTGAIYRVNLETEEVVLVHQHPFGVNTAIADSTGAIWFTQSSANAAGPETEAKLVEPLNTYQAQGALFRIAPPAADGTRAAPTLLIEGLEFGNGIAIDEGRGQLYFAETGGNRIVAHKVSVETGTLSDRRVLATILVPDNVELDDQGQVWVASPAQSAVFVINPDTGAMRTAFRYATPETEAMLAEWAQRAEQRQPVLELFAPPLWGPLPGPTTGIILTPGNGPVYVTSLGDALVKIER